MIFRTSMKMEHLLENEQAVAVFEQFLPGVAKMAGEMPAAAKLSVEQLVRYMKIPQGKEVLEGLEAALQALNTPENAISPSEAKLMERFREIEASSMNKVISGQAHHQDAIYPGKPWLDTNGNRIQAHGGAVMYEDGVYYWYVENKEYTDGQNGVWSWGIRVYSSTDLYNWQNRGLLIPPVLDNPNSALFPTMRLDRPHILKCEKTGMYVCWIKLSGPEAAFTILQAKSLLGPYEMVENIYNPGGHKVGDFDLISESDTGKGYLYFEADHASMLCMELSESYLQAEKQVAVYYENLIPPFTREAPALFEAKGKKYMFTSGMTGYVPNKSDVAVSEAWDGEFVSMGDPHVEDSSCASFNSQISKVFKVAGTENLFIAMADRWLPDTNVDARLADVFTRVVASAFEPDKYQATDAERIEMYEANKAETANTSISNYVWLPVEWDGDKPILRWRDEWTLDG